VFQRFSNLQSIASLTAKSISSASELPDWALAERLVWARFRLVAAPGGDTSLRVFPPEVS
jgi:hypothetical protein